MIEKIKVAIGFQESCVLNQKEGKVSGSDIVSIYQNALR